MLSAMQLGQGQMRFTMDSGLQIPATEECKCAVEYRTTTPPPQDFEDEDTPTWEELVSNTHTQHPADACAGRAAGGGGGGGATDCPFLVIQPLGPARRALEEMLKTSAETITVQNHPFVTQAGSTQKKSEFYEFYHLQTVITRTKVFAKEVHHSAIMTASKQMVRENLGLEPLLTEIAIRISCPPSALNEFLTQPAQLLKVFRLYHKEVGANWFWNEIRRVQMNLFKIIDLSFQLEEYITDVMQQEQKQEQEQEQEQEQGQQKRLRLLQKQKQHQQHHQEQEQEQQELPDLLDLPTPFGTEKQHHCGYFP